MKNFVCHLIKTVILFGSICSITLAADKPLVFENEKIKLRLFPRTPHQMAGFYEAREFPKKMVRVLTEFCFITAVIHNKTRDVFWLDLDDWTFISGAGEIQRVNRKQWPPRWEKMEIPMASQSTFRWTLLPESLEFFPDEHEGGNLIFVKTKNPFSLQASFAVGKNKKKDFIKVRINNVQCAEDIIEKGSDQ